jgi:predicted Zn-dependent protease with MMP-like domain
MTLEEFETTIEESLKGLPARFRNLLRKNDIPVLARERMPAPLRRQYRGDTVFGIFIGVPYGRLADYQTEPTRIELYLKTFERYFGDPAEMRRQIRRTVMHEIAHYFGFSEKEIRKLGY